MAKLIRIKVSSLQEQIELLLVPYANIAAIRIDPGLMPISRRPKPLIKPTNQQVKTLFFFPFTVSEKQAFNPLKKRSRDPFSVRRGARVTSPCPWFERVSLTDDKSRRGTHPN